MSQPLIPIVMTHPAPPCPNDEGWRNLPCGCWERLTHGDIVTSTAQTWILAMPCPEHSAPPPDLDAIEALVESAAPVVRRICVERTDLAALVAAVRHANTREHELRRALKRHGCHDGGCGYYDGLRPAGCTCGFTDALLGEGATPE